MIERKLVETRKRILTATEFHRLAEVPPEVEWFKNIRETEACIWLHLIVHGISKCAGPSGSLTSRRFSPYRSGHRIGCRAETHRRPHSHGKSSHDNTNGEKPNPRKRVIIVGVGLPA